MIKKLLLITFFVLCSSNTFSQITFQEQIVDSTNSIGFYNSTQINNLSLESSLSADFDGDGDKDVLAKSTPFVWYKNEDGLGIQFTKQIIDDTTTPKAFTIGDIDFDGDKDIVIGFSEGLYWYENIDGLGNFSEKQTIYTAASHKFYMIDVSDMDGDGDLDIISSSKMPGIYSDGIITWYENLDGLGNFGTQQIVATYNDTYIQDFIGVRIADFDEDNDSDILVTQVNGDIQLIENLDGLGNFNTPELIVQTWGLFHYLNIADLDNDGDIDFFFNTSSGIGIYLNDGIGNFFPNQNLQTSYDNYVSFSRAIDVDGDLDLDIICIAKDDNNLNQASIVFFENTNGLAAYSSFQELGDIHLTGNAFRFNTSDIDGDGLEDLICTYADGNELSWNKNMFNTIGFGGSVGIETDLTGVSDMQSIDIDGDGDNDILYVSSTNDVLGCYLNENGTINFNNHKIISVEGNGVYKLKFLDIDIDGDMDLVTLSQDEIIRIYENIDGLGNYSILNSFPTASGFATDINIFDVDLDGNLDIVTLENNGDEIVMFKNLGSLGNFEAPVVLTNDIDNLNGFNMSDIDGDGDLDIILSNPIAWLENTDGLGTFSSPQVIVTGVSNLRIKSFDADSDGDQDILFYILNSLTYTFQLNWIENMDGLGSFGDIHSIDNQIYSKNELIIDFDNDGDDDIISAANYSTNQIELKRYTNDNGNFTGPGLININTNIKSLLASDLNGDGSLDILYGTNENYGENGKIGWYNNLGVLENQISGVVTYDSNDNGCDSSDQTISNIMVLSYNSETYFCTFTDNLGQFITDVNTGDFNTTLDLNLPNYFTQTPIIHTSSFNNEGEVDNAANFCVVPNTTVNDVNISIYPLNDPRPGFDTTYQIVFKNVGTTQLSGDITFSFDDSKIQFLNASEVISTQTVNTITFNYSNLIPFETRIIDLDFNVFAPPITNINDILISTATINPTTGDETPDDNTFTLNQTVIGAYDPNDIRVLEGEEILLSEVDDYLHYIIRFQNTGTSSAINITVNNILDSKLDVSSLKIESMSHTGRVEITTGAVADFIFENINLADSTSDEPNSHGYIAYKIKPLYNVVLGDTFYNTADIFFDFNPAITTNTVATTIVDNLSIEDFEISLFNIYPNPANNEINILSNSNFDSISILDINGRELFSKKYNLVKEAKLDIKNLSEGMYFIQVTNKNQKEVKKFLKK